MAGAEAVARLDPAADRGDGDDLENARRTLAALYRGANVDRAVDALRRRTAALVAEHWAAVIETAEALLARK